MAGRVVVGLLRRFRACRLYLRGLTLSVMASEPAGKVSDPFCGDSVKGLTLFCGAAFFPRGGARGRSLAGGGARCGGLVAPLSGVSPLFKGPFKGPDPFGNGVRTRGKSV